MTDCEIIFNDVRFRIHWDTKENWFSGVRTWGDWSHEHHFYATTFGYLLADIELELSLCS